MTPIHVAVGVVVKATGEVLIARRRDDLHQGGLWEFPGGKIETGEAVYAALVRELDQEVGIKVERAQPLMQVRHHYPDKSVLLDVWRVYQWTGEAHGNEGQPIAWLRPDVLRCGSFPAANRPIINTLRLPDLYLISPEPGGEGFMKTLEQCLQAGVRLIQLRAQNQTPRFSDLTVQVLQHCKTYGARLLLNADPSLAIKLGVDGIHLKSEYLLKLDSRPVPEDIWLAASCHDEIDLIHAHAIGADFAVLSPVRVTTSHATASPLGWERFQYLARQASLPVYALGGLMPCDMAEAKRYGAQGLAMISGVWKAANPGAAVRACLAGFNQQ